VGRGGGASFSFPTGNKMFGTENRKAHVERLCGCGKC